MKKIFLLPLFVLLLTGCEEVNSSDVTPISSNTPISSSSVTALPPIQITDVYNEHEFTLEEFPDVKFKIGPRVLNAEGNLYVYPLYVNDVRVTEQTIDRLLFAYDVNKDGYRDLVFNEKVTHYDSYINGFDVHNNKKMVNNLGKRQYNVGLEIEGERLKAKAYMASTISSVTFDYAELAYNDEKDLYFEWDNMYQFKEFKLNKITLNDNGKTIVNPSINNNESIYNLIPNTDYVFEISAPREDNPKITDFNFDRMSGFDVSVGDEILGVNKFQYLSSENDIHKYLVNFTNHKTEFIYTFTLPCMSFSINVKLVAQ